MTEHDHDQFDGDQVTADKRAVGYMIIPNS